MDPQLTPPQNPPSLEPQLQPSQNSVQPQPTIYQRPTVIDESKDVDTLLAQGISANTLALAGKKSVDWPQRIKTLAIAALALIIIAIGSYMVLNHHSSSSSKAKVTNTVSPTAGSTNNQSSTTQSNGGNTSAGSTGSTQPDENPLNASPGLKSAANSCASSPLVC